MVMYFPDVSLEEEQARRNTLRRSRSAELAASFTPEQVSMLEQVAQRNPQLPPDAVLALVRAGVPMSTIDQIGLAAANAQNPVVALEPPKPNFFQRAAGAGLGAINAGLGAATSYGPAAWVGSDEFKQVTQIADPVFDVIPQGVQGAIRNTVTDYENAFGAFQRGESSIGDLLKDPNLVSVPGMFGLSGRDIGGAARDLEKVIPQTTAGQMAQELLETGKIDRSDWGSGYFINNEASIINRRRAAERRGSLLDDGQTITAGRFTAQSFGLDPDSRAYWALSGLIDASVMLRVPSVDTAFDPGAARFVQGLQRSVGGVPAATFMSSVGGYSGVTRGVNMQKASVFLDSTDGRRLVQDFADATGDEGFEYIWRRLGRKYDPGLVAEMAAADNPDDVRTALLAGLASDMVPNAASPLTTKVRKITAGWRFYNDLPDRALDLTNPMQATRFADEFGAHVKAPANMRQAWLAQMGQAGDEAARRAAYHRMMTDTGNLLEPKFGRDRADELTRYMDKVTAQDRLDWNEMVDMTTAQVRTTILSESDQRLPSPFILSERAKILPAPDLRELKRATGQWSALYETFDDPKGLQKLTQILGPEHLVGSTVDRVGRIAFKAQKVWKDMRLMRIAYPVRVVSEEQLRMSAAGYNSIFHHPISYFADVFHRAGRRGEFEDLLGDLLSDADEFRAARVGGDLGGMRDVGSRVSNPHLTRIQKDAIARSAYLEAWDDRIRTLASDQVVQQVARANSLDEVMDWLGRPVSEVTHAQSGAGARFLDELRSLSKGAVETDDDLYHYLESLNRWIEVVTGGSGDLRNVIRSGNNSNVWRNLEAPGVGNLAEDGVDGLRLTDFYDEFAPSHLTWIPTPDELGQSSMYDKATRRVFEAIGAAPTNTLSRSPMFRQEYKARIFAAAELADDVDEFVDAARKTGLFSRAELAELRRTAGGGLLDVETIDNIAKIGALEEVQGLLYDLSKRNQFFDSYRLVFPFGEAWKEVLTTWTRLALQNPARVSRRALMAAEAGRDAGVWNEDENGELVFAWPGSSALTSFIAERVTGVDDVPGTEITGRVGGLNMIGDMTPGVGPVVQYPASWLIPKDPNFDRVRGLIFPFGEPNSPADLTSNFVPTWFARLLRANDDFRLTPEQADLFANTKFRVGQQLASTGNYDRSTAAGRRRLEEDAEAAAQALVIIRSAWQLIAPTAPIMNQQALGPNGELVELAVMVRDYHALTQDDPESAMERFVDQYGIENLYAMGSNTVATVHGGVPLHGDGLDWVNENPDIVADHPELYGFVAPADLTGDFNYDAYLFAKERGELEQLSDDDKYKLVEHKFASDIYRRKRNRTLEANRAAGRATLTPEQKEWFRQFRFDLQQRFPGYNNVDDIVGKNDVVRVIDGGAIDGPDGLMNDPRLAGEPLMRTLAEYWRERQKVIDLAATADIATVGPGGWRQVAKMERQREWLRDVGLRLAGRDKQFAVMWDNFLQYEFKDDVTAVPVGEES